MCRAVHQFKVWMQGQWYLCPNIYNDEEFEAVMEEIHWHMPFGITAVHGSGASFHPAVQKILNRYPKLNCNIGELFRNQPGIHIRLKDKLRCQETNIIRKLNDFVICETECGIGRFVCVDGIKSSYLTDFEVVPLRWKEARALANAHRHNSPPQGHKFSIGLRALDEWVGVVIASEPKARNLAKDRHALEINRVCVDEKYANACSKLYAQAIRADRGMGYTRFITYSLPEESGSSLKAVGFRFDGIVPSASHGWDCPARPRKMADKYPKGEKLRWILQF